MLERSERIIKIVCLGLAAFLLYELTSAVLRHNPLEHMSIPALPALAEAPNAKAGGAETNSVPSKPGGKTGTNTAAAKDLGTPGTNSVAEASGKPGTNSIPAPEADKNGTNTAPSHASTKPETNATPIEASTKTETNSIAGPEPGKKETNAIAGTNLVSGTNGVSGTNVASRPASGRRAMNPGGRPGPGKPAAELPPVIQARIDKITDSEILGQVIRPMPMGLLGIAGEYAFLRAPTGQTELVKEGAEMGGIKLLKIGINRVLVEEAGEKKELTIFEGFGSETLLPKPTDKPNEIITKPK